VLAAAVAAGAAAAVVLLPVDGDPPTAAWLDTLAHGSVAALEDAGVAEGLPVYGFDEAEGDSWLLADPLAKTDAEATGRSSTSQLGYDYEVLAFWLAPEDDGDGAGNMQDVP
jgi:hypothetical protein